MTRTKDYNSRFRVKHEIKTSDEIPVHTGAYRNPFVYKQVGREMK
ncbi:unnamed protein product, partial [Tenebrio molitor]